ncbi:MAG: hypothetical protein MGU50_06325 [Trichodesmium sp. MAG_R02]|nr:hypothetical protein [Trichodesmium sp. MAG_R02]MCL2936217.1 hypothetical protein [Trichodesmium sp. MAG_R02]
MLKIYSAFQIDELHPHNQNLVGTLHEMSLLWSTDMKNAVVLSGQDLHRNPISSRGFLAFPLYR